MLRVGIVGCGCIFTMHATSADYLENAQIVGVCDIKKDRADKAAEKYHCKAYYDYKEMINKDNIDVVHVCVPHYLHPIISKYAIEAGVHVLCEKPMSIKYEDALENVNLAEKNNVKYGIIFQCRYNDSAKLVKEKIVDGTLGKIISARVVLTWCKPDDYYSLSDWKGTWDKEGGGVLIDQAIHSIDLANWFIDDEIDIVQAHLSNRGHSIMEVDDTAEGFIKYKNGATLGFWAMNNYGCDEPIEIRLLCENGKVTMDYDRAEIILNDGQKFTAETQIDPDVTYDGGKDYWGFQHIREIKDFYDAVENDREPTISGREALKIQNLICQIYEKGIKNFEAYSTNLRK
ncbi:MAG: Gfo/Idh/MocA family oxidoreductase [Ruminococcaceae bacterium]|nr:Gfo/Idh/MocA family oxidoreductase [Oscillospiraceae bacterium]